MPTSVSRRALVAALEEYSMKHSVWHSLPRPCYNVRRARALRFLRPTRGRVGRGCDDADAGRHLLVLVGADPVLRAGFSH